MELKKKIEHETNCKLYLEVKYMACVNRNTIKVEQYERIFELQLINSVS
jgi:hypothetical protein